MAVYGSICQETYFAQNYNSECPRRIYIRIITVWVTTLPKPARSHIQSTYIIDIHMMVTTSQVVIVLPNSRELVYATCSAYLVLLPELRITK